MPQIEDLQARPAFFPRSNPSIEIITDRQQILKHQSFLVELSNRCGQKGAMDHLEYFLTSKSSLRKTPYLVLIGAGPEHTGDSWQHALGASLLYEYRLLGCRTGVFATDDVCGRRTLIAPPHLRMHIARLTAEALMCRGALAVMQSPRYSLLDESLGLSVCTSKGRNRWTYALRRRGFSSYLTLESTMDATLAKMRQKSRFNLRYYRRRAAAELKSSFVEDLRMDRADFLSFNRRCSYAVGDDEAASRYDSIMKFPGMFLCGIKGGDGDWLSIVGGRRYHDAVEIDWQMNRSDLPAYSLSTVMRTYFIEHEIARGTRKMYIEGGTPHAMRHSFTPDWVCDFVVLKHPSLLWCFRSLIRRLIPKRNFLMNILAEERLRWQPWF